MENIKLQKGAIINNRELMDIFKCACEGGIRYSKKSDAIVLVINNIINKYPVKWDGNRLEFIGQAVRKDNLMSGLNKRLNEFLEKNGNVFLFEVNNPGEYTYKGKVQLFSYPFTKSVGNGEVEKTVWVFPLEIICHD